MYSASDIRLWDAYTIQNEPISSIDLMERAAVACTQKLLKDFGKGKSYVIVCGHGNNGGDGLAIARLLLWAGCRVEAYIFVHPSPSDDYLTNLDRFAREGGHAFAIMDEDTLQDSIKDNDIIVDAIMGTGNSRPLEGLYAVAVDTINGKPNPVVSIDLPSGIQADGFIPNGSVVKANRTYSFQCIKKAMLMPETGSYFGEPFVLDIGLHPDFVQHHPPAGHYVSHPAHYVNLNLLQVDQFAHKGIRGHAMIGAGSASMMGAALMATKAALRSGVGLVTVATHAEGWPILQQAAPEAMCAAPAALANAAFHTARRIKAIGIGPGWLADNDNLQILAWLLEEGNLPLVVDATAIGLLQQMKNVLTAAGKRKPIIITPYVGEFDRLFGVSLNHFDRLKLAKEMAVAHHIYIVLKGAFTRIITPNGICYFNSTGNHGMAKGGSGDVLTGLLTGLLAQGFEAKDACLLATWLQGKAGDLAATAFSTQAMTAMDIISQFPAAWKKLYEYEPA
ncbi:MAG TPA: NAD(P)H-hydrate dehydratase [Phnomibacter sp.]|nr:NAD(P)H-hydrate dehydratase [Phnomibacter sp.]